MRNLVIAVTFPVMAIGVACNRPSPSSTPVPAQMTADETHEAWPTKDEVLGYLDGKSISLSDPKDPPGQKNTPHVLKRSQIDALEVSRSGSHSGGEPWSTEVSFFVNTGEASYAVVARVQHRLIETKRAFFGIQVQQVSRQ